MPQVRSRALLTTRLLQLDSKRGQRPFQQRGCYSLAASVAGGPVNNEVVTAWQQAWPEALSTTRLLQLDSKRGLRPCQVVSNRNTPSWHPPSPPPAFLHDNIKRISPSALLYSMLSRRALSTCSASILSLGSSAQKPSTCNVRVQM